ncbi:MAG: cation transporter, partial [Candidatus Heimdallarchaeota archaeon]
MVPGANAPLERLHVKIGGMQCSFCVESIRKAISRMAGVQDVGVNLSHEEALIVYNPEIVTDSELKDTLRSLGYTIRDPNKLQNFDQEAAELRRHGRQLLVAGFLVFIATLMMITSWVGFRQSWFPVFMLTLTVVMIFGVGWPILKMALASLRRGIL